MDKVLRICKSPDEADAVDLEQWLELTGDERLRIGEAMRRQLAGEHEQRLERVLRVAERQED